VYAIEEGREPVSSGRENLLSLALMEAAVQSSGTGLPVTIATP
jgi:predicted dehydrogenase